MRAVLCQEYGPYHDVSIADVAEPVLAPGSVLIHVAAAGVGFANVLVIAGKHQDVAGTINAVADDVDRQRPGQRVVAGMPRGAFA